MKVVNVIAIASIIGISLNCIGPAKADWSQEMYNCQVSFKDSFSQTIANRGLFVKNHGKLDAMAYDYCFVSLTAVATGDSMSVAMNLGLRHIRNKYGF